MEARELRIGNWVEYKKGQQATVSHISSEKNGYIGVENNEYLSSGVFELVDFKPIPLTEEWLERFGFENDFDENPTKGQLTIENQFDGSWIRVLDGMWTDGIKIEYIHQLQNLYFALTGEELTIKEDEYISQKYRNTRVY